MRKFFVSLFLLTAITVATGFAQETETKVVDEVVAQVNDGVITLSRVRRELKEIIDAKVAEGMKREEAQKFGEEKQGELIANLINEELLLQKAKELGIDDEVEASLNQRFLDLMKQFNLKTIDSLYEEMRRQNVDPQEMREVWRKQATRERVIEREVQSKIYWTPTATQLRAYYDKNKSKFTKQESVTISELFLSFAGRDEAAVRQKAKDLLAQLRGGADFVKMVAENSDRPNAANNKGKGETIPMKELDPRFAEPLKGVGIGGYTEPIETSGLGLSILRVDERQAASDESEFKENAVRIAMLQESFPEASKKFLAKLRADSYIKISDTYRPIVSPILFADERKDKTTN